MEALSPVDGWPPWNGERVPQLAAGQTGKNGLLELRLGRQAQTGRTVLQALCHRAPLQMGRLLYPDASLPDMAYCYTAMVSGGLVQGDRLRVRVTVEPGARAHVTTLAATKIYGMDRNLAAQHVALAVGAGSSLEWWPDPVIPFRRSRFWQGVRLTVHPDGLLLYGDLLLPGRVAGGERHNYTYYRSRVVAHRPDGRLLFNDLQALAPPPAGGAPLSETLPECLQVIGTVYILAADAALPSLLAALRAQFAGGAHAPPPGGHHPPAVLAGCSTLPNGCGVAVRILATGATPARQAMQEVAVLVRHHLLGCGPPVVRKGMVTVPAPPAPAGSTKHSAHLCAQRP